MTKTKVAVIGCGTIANSAHIPGYCKNEKAEIKYFCDIIPEKAEKCVEKYGCGNLLSDNCPHFILYVGAIKNIIFI